MQEASLEKNLSSARPCDLVSINCLAKHNKFHFIDFVGEDCLHDSLVPLAPLLDIKDAPL